MKNFLDGSFELNNPPCIQEVIDNDAVIIDLDTGTYHNMKGFSGTVWTLVIERYQLDKIVAALCTDDATKQLFGVYLNQFIEMLLAKNLVRTCGSDNEERPPAIELPDDIKLDCTSYTDMQELLALDPIHEVDDTVGWPQKKEAS